MRISFAPDSRVLVLAPHPDDGELGAGGTIAKLIAEGVEVHSVAFSPCRKSLPVGFPPDTLEKEMRSAAGVLGLPAERTRLYDFPVREFGAHRQEILDTLLGLRKNISPDLVLMPCSTDVHQDHQVIFAEARRAFKHSSLLGYELPWNTFGFPNGGYVRLSEEEMAKKISALAEYRSQAHREYTSPEALRSLAVMRGMQAGSHLAEAFEVIRWILD